MIEKSKLFKLPKTASLGLTSILLSNAILTGCSINQPLETNSNNDSVETATNESIENKNLTSISTDKSVTRLEESKEDNNKPVPEPTPTPKPSSPDVVNNVKPIPTPTPKPSSPDVVNNVKPVPTPTPKPSSPDVVNNVKPVPTPTPKPSSPDIVRNEEMNEEFSSTSVTIPSPTPTPTPKPSSPDIVRTDESNDEFNSSSIPTPSPTPTPKPSSPDIVRTDESNDEFSSTSIPETYPTVELETINYVEVIPDTYPTVELETANYVEVIPETYPTVELETVNYSEVVPETYPTVELETVNYSEVIPETYPTVELETVNYSEVIPETYPTVELETATYSEVIPETYPTVELETANYVEVIPETYPTVELESYGYNETALPNDYPVVNLETTNVSVSIPESSPQVDLPTYEIEPKIEVEYRIPDNPSVVKLETVDMNTSEISYIDNNYKITYYPYLNKYQVHYGERQLVEYMSEALEKESIFVDRVEENVNIEPTQITYIDDPTKPLGQEVVMTQGSDGYERVVTDFVKTHRETLASLVVEREKVEMKPTMIYRGTKVETTLRTVKENIVKFTTETQYDPEMFENDTSVVREGSDGYTNVTYRDTLNSDVESVEVERQVVEMIPKIVKVGTKKRTQARQVRENIINFETITTKNSDMFEGDTNVIREGQEGYDLVEYIEYLDNSRQPERRVISTVKATPKLVEEGTKPTTKRREVRENIVKFERQVIEDETLEEGQEIVSQTGVNGYDIVVYEDNVKDPTQPSKELRRTTIKPVTEIVKLGVRHEVEIEEESTHNESVETNSSQPSTNVPVFKDVRLGAIVGGYRVTGLPQFSHGVNENTTLEHLLTREDVDKLAFDPSISMNFTGESVQNGGLYYRWLGLDNAAVYVYNTNESVIDDELLNKYFLELLNKERRSKGLNPLKYEPGFQNATNQRSKEMSAIGHIRYNNRPHTRPDGTSWNTVMKDVVNHWPYGIGENILGYAVLSNPFQLVSEKYIAHKMFEQWKSSPSHYQNMMHPLYKRMAVGIKISTRDGEQYGNETNLMVGTQILSAGEVGDLKNP